MPKVNAQADVAHDWRGLIDALDKNPDLLQLVQDERKILGSSLDEFQVVKGEQEELTAKRQEATQRLGEVVKRGKDVAIQIRSVLRGKVGPRSELLVLFKVAPIRKRGRSNPLGLKPKGGRAVRTEPVVSAPPPTEPVI